MAILAALPELDIINGFKGTLDFYVYMAIPCCRSWPHKTAPPTPDEEAQWPTFTLAARMWPQLSETIQDAARTQASRTNMSGRDLAMKLYLNATPIYPGLGTYAYQ